MQSKDMTCVNLDLITNGPRQANIYQGNVASACEVNHRFDFVIMCAEEFQLPESLIIAKGNPCRLIYAPNDDDRLSLSTRLVAINAAEETSFHFARGKRILVTCHQGRNRSGLVTAMMLHLIYGYSGRRAANIVKAKRKGAAALTNPFFNDFLNQIPACPLVKPARCARALHRRPVEVFRNNRNPARII